VGILPPDLGAAEFAGAIEKFERAVGVDWVFTSEEDLGPYRDSFSPVWNTSEERLASAAVAPADVAQVQAIVRIANEYRVPLYPISTGKNFGYGGPSPNVSGSVVVDLKRMNRVLEVDEKRSFALVEPGVSYFDLYRYIQERKLKVWIDCPDPGWGSLIGNALERGVGYTMGPFRDHFGASCGMEVVLPNGELMRTGMGALPGSESWQEYRYGFGPDPGGLFAQGNFGIVTKMGFRLFPQPEHYRTALITVPRRRDFVELVEIVNYLSDSFLCGEAVYGSPLAALLSSSPDFLKLATKRGGPSDAEMDAVAAGNNLPSWQVELQFYGPEAGCAANWAYAKDRILSAIPGAKAREGESLDVPLSDEQVLNTGQPYPSRIKRNAALGIPSLGIWKIVRDDGHVGFFPILPRSAEEVFRMQRVMCDALHEYPFAYPFFSAVATPLHWHTFAFQMVFAPSVKHDDPEHNAQVDRAMRTAIDVAAAHGWGDYRAAPIYQDVVMNSYAFGDHSMRRFHESMKDAIDPNGIIAPGRGGIWPRRFRES
jgi:FAD/FMN-containing dehydrogenase